MGSQPKGVGGKAGGSRQREYRKEIRGERALGHTAAPCSRGAPENEGEGM